jgi:hypothetical protein
MNTVPTVNKDVQDALSNMILVLNVLGVNMTTTTTTSAGREEGAG